MNVGGRDPHSPLPVKATTILSAQCVRLPRIARTHVWEQMFADRERGTMSTPSSTQNASLSSDGTRTEAPWWQSGVLYQIYPRSFVDSNGDGVGDIPGITSQLDYLHWLGVDGIWLSPITVSPNKDWGYDVADFYDIDPELGTIADLDELVAEAKSRNIRILMDLVPNHSSDKCAWFVEAAASKDSEKRDWYVWADPAADGGPPNNWLAHFGGPAWTLHEPTGQYFMHNFLPEQPDFNWWSDGVRDEFDAILRFWMDRGVAGFRIDVCHGIVHDHELRDNPPRTVLTGSHEDHWPQLRMYNINRPEVHDVIRRWRKIADEYDGGVLLGETNPESLEELALYYGNGHDELHLAFNFPFAHAGLEADSLREIVEEMKRMMPADSWPVWTLSNHDISRVATRWFSDEEDRASVERKIRCALAIIFSLRGTPVLYYGDEIAMEDVAVPNDALLDPCGIRALAGDELQNGRDPERTPMQWNDSPGAGFTTQGAIPWLPIGDTARISVAAQREDDSSVLNYCHTLIRVRRDNQDLHLGSYEALDSIPGVWLWKRGETILAAVNTNDVEISVELPFSALELLRSAGTDLSPTPATTVRVGVNECVLLIADGS